jgi:hypothetical protein
LANRVLQVTKNEAENSEDPRYISTLNVAADQLQTRELTAQWTDGAARNVEGDGRHMHRYIGPG